MPIRSLDWPGMCGRYRLTAKERYLRHHFGLDDDISWSPRWSIATHARRSNNSGAHETVL